MSATISIYSHQSDNSWNSVHLYAPEFTHAFDTTHTSTKDRIRKKPMTVIFIKTIPDKETNFPPTDSPPTPPFTDTTHTHTHYQRHYGHARNYDSSTVTDNFRLPSATQPPKTTLPQTSGTRKLPNFHFHINNFLTARLQLQPAAIHCIFQSLRKITNCIPLLKATTAELLLPRATHHASSKPWTPPGSQHLPASTDIFPLHTHQWKLFTLIFTLQQHQQHLQLSLYGFWHFQLHLNLLCQVITQIPTALTPHLPSNQQIAQ
jgi:hypothetical protein